MSLADAIVAVAFDGVAGVPIMQINVGRAVRVGTSTELWQVTRVTGLSTEGASHLQLAVFTALSVGAHGTSLEGACGGVAAWVHAFLWLPTVTLLSLLHVAVAALLSAVENLDLGHVVQTHAHSFLQTGSKVLLTACTEHGGEWIPSGGGHDAASTIDGHPAATAALWGVVVHAKIVSQFVCQSHGCAQRVLRVIHDNASRLLHCAHAHNGCHADGGALEVNPAYQLSVVVGFLWQQFDFPPVEELVQGGEGILGDGTFVGVAPNLQTHQGHTDVQGPVELVHIIGYLCQSLFHLVHVLPLFLKLSVVCDDDQLNVFCCLLSMPFMPCMEGLEGAFDVVFRSNRRHVEAMAAGSWGKSEFFHSVDEVGTVVLARRRLNDECLVFKCNETSKA